MALGDNAAREGEHPVGVFKRLGGDGTVEVLGTAPQQYTVGFHYKNYRGEAGYRKVIPIHIVFGANEWHPEPQWLLYALDLEKNAPRFFAMKDIKGWMPL